MPVLLLLLTITVLGWSRQDRDGYHSFDPSSFTILEHSGEYYDSSLRNLEYQRNNLKNYTKTLNQLIGKSKDLLETAEEYENNELDQKKFEEQISLIKEHLEDMKDTRKVLHKLRTSTRREIDRISKQRNDLIQAKLDSVSKRHEIYELLQSLTESIKNERHFIKELTAKQEEWNEKLKKQESKFTEESYDSLDSNWKSASSSEIKSVLSRDGILFFQGQVRGGVLSELSPAPILTVEASHQHPLSHNSVLTLANNRAGHVTLSDSGTLSLTHPSSASWFSLDGIYYISKMAPLVPLKPHTPFEVVEGSELGLVKTRMGMIHLQGQLLSKDENKMVRGQFHGIVLAKLKEEYRPKKWICLPAWAGDELGRIDIDSDGSILATFPIKSREFSLDGLVFPSRSASMTVVPRLSNGWQHYNNNHPKASYLQTEDGIVYLSGTIKNGLVLPEEGVIFTLPSRMRPRSKMVFKVLGDNEIFRVDVFPNGNVVATEPRGSEHAWISLNGIAFSTNHPQ